MSLSNHKPSRSGEPLIQVTIRHYGGDSCRGEDGHETLRAIKLLIKLEPTEPRVWRRPLAQDSLAIYQLHEILQVVKWRCSFRKPPPSGCKLHKSILAADEIEEREGFNVTTPLSTLLDAATSGVSQEQLNLAVKAAINRGLVRHRALKEAALASPHAARLTQGLKKLIRKWPPKRGYRPRISLQPLLY